MILYGSDIVHIEGLIDVLFVGTFHPCPLVNTLRVNVCGYRLKSMGTSLRCLATSNIFFFFYFEKMDPRAANFDPHPCEHCAWQRIT